MPNTIERERSSTLREKVGSPSYVIGLSFAAVLIFVSGVMVGRSTVSAQNGGLDPSHSETIHYGRYGVR